MNYKLQANGSVAGNQGTSQFGDTWNSRQDMPPDGRNKAKCNFILQQGFDEAEQGTCPQRYSALVFQPRFVLITIVAGILLQSAAVFAALSALLLWNALFPKWNPLSALYNLTFGQRPDAYRMPLAPPPRRAAERMAGIFALAIALLIQGAFAIPAYVLQAIFLAAALAVEIASFCPGSFMYHLLSGRRKFALRTLPWAS